MPIDMKFNIDITEIHIDSELFYLFWGIFLNRRAAARYRALASIIPGRERFSWKLSF
jgi:hypothetical protein